jgi:4-hydroxy-4-methyl-2-oxoglutarate aldolase
VIERLLQVEVSALCDADKTMPVVDPAIRRMAAGDRMAGVARTVVAEDDHLPVYAALAEAVPGEVLVITTNGRGRAVCGELFTAEAQRRGLAGIVIDGYCRDLAGIRRLGLPVYARGTTPASGSVVARPGAGQTIVCGGVTVAPGDIVFGDDDGVVIAPPARIAAALTQAEATTAAEQAFLAAVAGGTSLHDLLGDLGGGGDGA